MAKWKGPENCKKKKKRKKKISLSAVYTILDNSGNK